MANDISFAHFAVSVVSDPKIISDLFNHYFATVGPEIERNIPFVPGSLKYYFSKKDKLGWLLINLSNSSFFLSPTVPGEIRKIIDKLDTKKSTGPNSIPVFILKVLKPFFSFWLSQLINISFIDAIFPDFLKIAKVSPLRNYRPISLFSVFSKIFEKTVYTRIYTYLVKNNLIFEKQYGFRSNYSTNHALISITEND